MDFYWHTTNHGVMYVKTKYARYITLWYLQINLRRRP